MLGSQVSAAGSPVRVIGYGYGCGPEPEPAPAPEHLNLGPDGRDPGPENDFIPTDAMSSHPYPMQSPATCHPGLPPAT